MTKERWDVRRASFWRPELTEVRFYLRYTRIISAKPLVKQQYSSPFQNGPVPHPITLLIGEYAGLLALVGTVPYFCQRLTFSSIWFECVCHVKNVNTLSL